MPLNARRNVVLAFGAGVLAAAARSLAQQREKVWRIGVLSARRGPASLDADYYGGFPDRMRELGYVEGRNLAIEWRFAEGRYERLPALAAELVKMNVDVILALGPPGALAAQKATASIPVVMVVSVDPVAAGLVKSLRQPGGNITGLSNLGGDLGAKHVEMLQAVVPRLASVAVLFNPANAGHVAMQKNIEAAARKSGIGVLRLPAQTAAEIDAAFVTIAKGRSAALIVTLDPFFIQQEAQIAGLATRHRLPSIFPNREYAQAGGLLSYGQNQREIYRRAAGYVDRILKGAKPRDLPVEEPTRLELVVNERTAKAIGVTLPRELLLRADHVID